MQPDAFHNQIYLQHASGRWIDARGECCGREGSPTAGQATKASVVPTHQDLSPRSRSANILRLSDVAPSVPASLWCFLLDLQQDASPISRTCDHVQLYSAFLIYKMFPTLIKG